IYKGLQFYRAQNFEILEYAVYGIIFSFIAGLMTISLMMQWMSRYNFKYIVLYRIILGLFILFVAHLQTPQEKSQNSQCIKDTTISLNKF
ncbi:MAG: hypothetical protein K1X44_06380, partial [Alphaproteobacteria bacterium]|nr:hypothetical protein [Alphaproteobacteria bacterium]